MVVREGKDEVKHALHATAVDICLENFRKKGSKVLIVQMHVIHPVQHGLAMGLGGRGQAASGRATSVFRQRVRPPHSSMSKH